METLGLGLFFEDLPIGRSFKTIGRTITETDIINFVTCTGMTEVLFTNFEFQKEESDIKGRVCPGRWCSLSSKASWCTPRCNIPASRSSK